MVCREQDSQCQTIGKHITVKDTNRANRPRFYGRAKNNNAVRLFIEKYSFQTTRKE